MQKYENRSEVPEEYKWDLSSFFKSEADFNETLKKANSMIDELKQYKNCLENKTRLYEYLSLQIETLATWQDLFGYSILKVDEDVVNATNLERKNKVLQLGTEYEKNTSFFAPALLKLSKENYEQLYKENPKLYEFKFYLDSIYREKEHILSEKEEQIIAELSSSMNHFEEIYSTMLNGEHNFGTIKVDGEKHTIALTNYRKLMQNKDENIRKKIYRSLHKTLDQYGATTALALSGYVSSMKSLAKIRKYKSSWDSKLSDWNLSDRVFKTLVSTTENNLDILHKYYELRKDVLGLPIMHAYDNYLDLETEDIEYTIEEAKELVKKAVQPLGDNYQEKLNKVFDKHYIDYCQYKGKCSGGYSLSAINQDARILLSFNGTFDSVSTIIHECGHAVHHQYISEYNKKQYREVVPLVSEVCSLTNECLLSSYMAKYGKTKSEKLSGISNILSVITSNLFGAVREGKLEQEIYKEVEKNGSVSREFLDKKTKNSLKRYYGPAIKIDKNCKNAWILRSHYYMHFYLYSYAICISVACSIASSILKGDKDTLQKYNAFLKQGADKWPTEAFQTLGIKLEDSSVYENAIHYYEEMIDLYRKIEREEE